jgi:hypothetical protein
MLGRFPDITIRPMIKCHLLHAGRDIHDSQFSRPCTKGDNSTIICGPVTAEFMCTSAACEIPEACATRLIDWQETCHLFEVVKGLFADLGFHTPYPLAS